MLISYTSDLRSSSVGQFSISLHLIKLMNHLKRKKKLCIL